MTDKASRQQRRAAKRKPKLGDAVFTQTIMVQPGNEIYWFECAKEFNPADGIPPDTLLHGPFKTEAEAEENQRLALLGPDCIVHEAGQWDPAWDKPQ
jgi:hypothetical protein